MIRAFVGVRIGSDVARKLAEAQLLLRRSLPGIRWVETEKLHFTLKFLGGVEEEKIEPIIKALEGAVRALPPFSIISRGIGVFPDMRRPRVLWVGLEGKALAPLAMAVEAALEPVGFARERRPFRPHLTIGRWRGTSGQPNLLKQELDRWKDFEFGLSLVDEVIFFQSVLTPKGAIYTPVGVIPLSA